MASEEGWRSLEPASLLVNLVPDLWRTLKSAWPLLVAAVLGGPVAGVANLGFVLLFFALAVARTVVHFATLRYRVVGGRLELRSGLLSRQVRLIDGARVQNIEIVQNVFHRAAGLVELRIETAGEGGIEGMLSAISVEEARRLQGELARAEPERVSGERSLLDIDWLELLAYGVSAGRAGAAVLVLGVGLEVLGPMSPEAVSSAVQGARPGALVGLALLAVAGAYAVSVGGAILRFYGFRMSRSARGVLLESGLLVRRRVEIPLPKVQLARVEEPWVRRAMGYGTLHVETAAVGMPNEEVAAEGMVPMVERDAFAEVLRLVLPRLDLDPWRATLARPAPRALYRGVIAAMLRWSIGAGAIAGWTRSPWPFALVPVGMALAWLDWRVQGWALTPRHLVTRDGFLTRRTVVVGRDKLQSVHLRQGPLLLWHRLGRVEVWVAGARVAVPDLREDDARALFAELSQQEAHGPDGGDHAGEVGDDPGGHGVPGLVDPDGAEVDREHVERGLGGALHGADDVPDEAVGPVGAGELAGEREGAGAGEGPDERERQSLGGHADERGDRRDAPQQELHRPAGAEHADRGEDRDDEGDDPDRR